MVKELTVDQLKKIGKYNEEHYTHYIYVLLRENDDSPKPVMLEYNYHPEWGDSEYEDAAIVHTIGSDYGERYDWKDYDVTWVCYHESGFPRVLTLEEIKEFDGAMFMELLTHANVGSWVFYDKSSEGDMLTFISENQPYGFRYNPQNYGVTWRCWSERPLTHMQKDGNNG